jgi:hypothetical protein
MSGTALAVNAAIPHSDDGSDGDADDQLTQLGRSVSTADIVGVLVVVSVMLTVNQAAVVWAGTPLGTSRGIRLLSLATGVAAALGVLYLAVREHGRPAGVVRSATQVWRDPPGDWVALALGSTLALPFLGLYWPRQGQHSDSARLLSSVDHVWRGDLGYLVDVQEPYLPHMLHGPAMAVGGLPAARFLTITTFVLLAGVTALITHRITRSLWGAAASVVALACIDGAARLTLYSPMYPLMLTLGYVGGWLAYRAVTDAQGRWRYSLGAGICIALAPEAHAVGQLFVAAPVLVAVLAPTPRLAVTRTARTYAIVVVALLPRLAINTSQGGLDWIRTYRTDWWVTQGYVRHIQENLWDYHGINEPLGYYLSHLPGRYYAGLGGWGWIVVGGVLLGWLCCRWRHRFFILGVVGFMLLAITVEQIPAFSRYYSPLFPGMAMLSGVLIAVLLRQRRRLFRAAGVICAACLLVGAAGTFHNVRRVAEHFRQTTEDTMPVQRLVASIDDDRGVIGARAHQLVFGVTADIPTWGDQFLSEDEYVTYLTWPSDEEVLDLLARYDIGWIVIHNNHLVETKYNDVWLQPFHGRTARHIEAVAASPNFCPWFEENLYRLYKVGPCEPAAAPSDDVAG